MTKYTLRLYVDDSSDIPVSCVTTLIGDGRHRKSAKFGHAYVLVEEGSDIFDLPSGTNPRQLNSALPKVKNIKKTLLEKHGFAVYNGGLCIVIDDNSFEYDPVSQTISFTCSQASSGHYDGQHTLEAVRQGVPDLELVNQIAINFVENSFFESDDERMFAGETWNTRVPQKLNSELNARGVFDKLKGYLPTLFSDNIAWRENDTNIAGDIITKEARIDRVIALLYTAAPHLRSEVLGVGDDMYNILRKGYKSALILDNPDQAADFEKIFPVASDILRLSDHIQSTLREAYEKNCGPTESFDELAIVRKAGKADLKKDVEKRKLYKQMLFDGTQVEGALPIDYMQPIMYGLLQNVLSFDRRSGTLSLRGYTIDEVMSIWDASCYDVLSLFENKFKAKFTSVFNSRHAEFGCWTYLWQEAQALVQQAITDNKWREDYAL